MARRWLPVGRDMKLRWPLVPLICVLLGGCASQTRQSIAQPVATPIASSARYAPPKEKPGSRTMIHLKGVQNPHHSLFGKWVDEQGTVYNFRSSGLVTWSHPVGSTAANFNGKYTLTEGELVIIPQGASSPQGGLRNQLRTIKGKHRLTEYVLQWQPDSSLVLSNSQSVLRLTPIK